MLVAFDQRIEKVKKPANIAPFFFVSGSLVARQRVLLD